MAVTTSRIALALLCGIGIAASVSVLPATAVRAHADSGPIVTVMNTSETPPDGVFFRSSASIGDTDGVPGHGVYAGEQVQLQCFAWGDPVGPYSDSLWYSTTNVSRPTNNGVANDGFLSAHYVDDGMAANQVDPGVPQCGSAAPPSGPSSVFYSPNDSPDGVGNTAIADLNLPHGQWGSPQSTPCASTNAANLPSGVSTLAGWSLGRLGPIYFLAAASADKVAQVHRIILFDPGGTSDFIQGPWSDTPSCDSQYDINSLLANWLVSNPANQLIVLTGQASEEPDWWTGNPTFAGLWHYYFAGIWNQPFANQAVVCDYNNLDHPSVLSDLSSIVQNPTPGCPPAPSGVTLTSWSP